ncbi:MAG: sulfatase [Verrucomicrobia bacterium]|nr:sulfatase [Verrucomicrobiota bacterium]
MNRFGINLMRSHSLHVSLLSLLCVLCLSPKLTSAATQNPNIILIFVDDLGYADIGPFGSKYPTPNLERMAQDGRRFTNFYSTSPVCTPSRASLMTGCYPRRVGMAHNERGQWVLFPGNHKGLHPDEFTMAELLKEQDYATACVGKWHLGDQPRFLPTRQGFDTYFGIPFSNDMGHFNTTRGYPPLPLMRNESVIEEEPDQALLTKRYTDEAVKFIKANREGPFFLYLPHTMPHIPIHVSDDFKDQSGNGPIGDAVQEIDGSTGRILDTLEELKIEDNTLVIFTSDNGGTFRSKSSNAPLRGQKGEVWEGGMRVCTLMQWPGVIPTGTDCHELTTTMDLLPTFAKLTGGTLPGNRIIDGRDIWPLISGQPDAKTPHEAFYYYWMNHLCAVRSGKWKLHVSYIERNSTGMAQTRVTELYDLENDAGETTNVAAENPEVVKRLKELIQKTRIDLGDGPYLGRNTRPAGYVETAHYLTHEKTNE